MRWLVRLGFGIALIATLALGRWIDDAWPTDQMDTRSFEHAAKVGEKVSLRYADLRVENVTATRAIATTSTVASTNGTWLVIDATLSAKRTPLKTEYWRVTDSAGRVFELDGRTDSLVLTATPKVPWHVRLAFELPAGDLAGTTLRLSPVKLDERREDVAVVDLGITEKRAVELDQLTDLVAIKQSSSFEQPPLPGEPGYDKVWSQ